MSPMLCGEGQPEQQLDSSSGKSISIWFWQTVGEYSRGRASDDLKFPDGRPYSKYHSNLADVRNCLANHA